MRGGISFQFNVNKKAEIRNVFGREKCRFIFKKSRQEMREQRKKTTENKHLLMLITYLLQLGIVCFISQKNIQI